MCPYYLDGDQTQHVHGRLPAGGHEGPVIPVFQPPLIGAADVASVQFSRTAKRHPAGWPVIRSRICAPGRRPADVGLSKLNSMLNCLRPLSLARSPSSEGERAKRPSSQVRSTC